MLLVLVLPSVFWLVTVWIASEAERRAFLRQVNLFDDVTPVLTPRVRMTLYRSLIDRTRQKTLKILTPRTDRKRTFTEQIALQQRKRVFLRFRSIGTKSRDSGEQITVKMKH